MTDDFDPEVQFFQFVEDLQRRHPQATPIGSTRSVAEEIVRFKANPSLAFPASEIAAVAPNAASEGVLDVTLNLIGLHGPASPLPPGFTERVMDAEANKTVRDFLDLFNHRLAGLLFLVYRHYRRDLRYAAGASDPLSLAVGSLFGLLPQTDAMPERTRVMLMPYTGLLAMGSRSARASAGILSHVLGVAARIEEFVPRRIDLPQEAQFRLGSGLELGVETLIGDSIADVTGHCRIWLGPLPFDRFLTFLPDSSDYGDLLHLIDFVVNEPLSRDLGFVIEAQSVPGWALGEGKLGWTTWAEPPTQGTIDTIMAAGA